MQVDANNKTQALLDAIKIKHSEEGLKTEGFGISFDTFEVEKIII